MIDYVYDKKIKPELNDFLGSTFEKICMDYLKHKNKKMELPFVFEKIGRWWRNELLNMNVVNALIEKAQALSYENKYYIYFSKSGFTEDVINFSENNNILLVDFSKDIIL